MEHQRKQPVHSSSKSTETDHMLKQAIYNTAAQVFVILAGLGVVALYYVLESFLRPLLWAMLCGSFLYPFKHRVTRNVKSWLTGLRDSSTPIAIGILVIPVDILNVSAENLFVSVRKRWQVICVVTLVFVSLYITYHHAPMDSRELLNFFVSLYNVISTFITMLSFKWVLTVAIAYCIIVIRFWAPENKTILSWLSIPVWFLLLLCTITNAGTLRVPLAGIVIVFTVVGCYADMKNDDSNKINKENEGHCVAEEEQVTTSPKITFAQQFLNLSSALMTSFADTTSGLSTEGERNGELDDMTDESSSALDLQENSEEIKAHSNNSKKVDLPTVSLNTFQFDGKPLYSEKHEKNTTNFTTNEQKLLQHTTSKPTQVPSKETTPNFDNQSSTESSSMRKRRRRSDICFIFLFWAIALVITWSHVWMLSLIPILIVFLGVKKLTKSAWQWLSEEFHIKKPSIQSYINWTTERLDVIVPQPLRGLIKLALRGDRKTIEMLLQSADIFITTVFIVLLLVGLVIISFTVCVQVQKEGIHLVSVTSNLVRNNTMQPEWLTEFITGNNETVGFSYNLDPMIKNVYTFGREWLKSQIEQRVSHKAHRKQLEDEILGIWDSLYESWVNKNTTMIAKPNYNGALFSQITAGSYDLMWRNINVNLSGIVGFIRENIGFFQSVLESVWILLKGNVNLAFTVLISSLQVILGGGTAILNFALSFIVFFTTLFYLLASSSDDYKPVEWITKLTIARAGSKFALAVEDGIGGVFAATLKMATFYGLYTWLTHTVFGINIVFLPSVFAAILGAIPFVGTYWAALPAVLELSLIHKEVFLGVLLAIFHILPTLVVDTAIYSDIKGGGHPYLTGLAIAGGLYCSGLQGAIIGPVLLCCIIVAMNLYSTMLNPDHPATTTPQTPGSVSFLNSSIRKGRKAPDLARSASLVEM